MSAYSDLNEEIHHITELSNILQYLFNDRSMCDTRTCCDLLNKYMKLVKDHFDFVEKNLYSDLLKDSDQKANTIANNFMSGSVEIKRIIKDFAKQWCGAKYSESLRIKDHAKFLEETQTLFELILQRIQDETEHLYPMVRQYKIAS